MGFVKRGPPCHHSRVRASRSCVALVNSSRCDRRLITSNGTPGVVAIPDFNSAIRLFESESRRSKSSLSYECGASGLLDDGAPEPLCNTARGRETGERGFMYCSEPSSLRNGRELIPGFRKTSAGDDASRHDSMKLDADSFALTEADRTCATKN